MNGPKKISFFKERNSKQSDDLFMELEKLFKKAKVKRHELGLIAVDTGPGSFTGVRVGVTVARTLAQALKLSLVGIPSLEAILFEHRDQMLFKDHVFIPTLAALPGEVYFSAYFSKQIESHQWVSLDVWAKVIEKYLARRKSVAVICDEKTKLAASEVLKSKSENVTWLGQELPPHPESIASLALQQFIGGKKSDFYFEKTIPLYLQPSWAERRKK